MSTALSTIQPLSPLATRSLQFLPDWVYAINQRMAKSVFGRVVTVYLNPLPTPEQRAAIESSRANLITQLDQTPDKNPELNDRMLDDLGELIASKPHRSDEGAIRREALIRSFGYALGDLPVWATLRAIRNWHRNEVDAYYDPKGKYNCRWAPSPVDLREIAKRYAAEVEDRIELFDDILSASDQRNHAGRLVGPKSPKPRDRYEGGFRLAFDGYALPKNIET